MSRAIRHLMHNPNALMRFHQTGEMPRPRDAPASPLRELLDRIPPRYHPLFRGIVLSPKLGFSRPVQFQTASQLYRWLGHNQKLFGNESLPYMSHQIRSFRERLTVDDLIAHCASTPPQSVIDQLN
ncbi:hypothetical protein [Vibrio alfacsensis]|uniref:hypothetical protein n=1 Tax=Vibrio alfacsensis TaxID=1074311 RepID=UPI001C7F317E|nr:hypothetical protein [Vibrio alfacsensis]